MIPTQEAMRASLLDAYARADAETVATGRAWYRVFGQTAEELAAGYPRARETGAGVVAALSPRIRWDINLRLARDVLQERPIRGVFGANVVKAERIRCGEAPLDVLGGEKTRAFYPNLLGKMDWPTIDVWAMRAAGVEKKSLTPKQYAAVADAYIGTANHVGLLPAEFQAVVWIVERGRAE